MSFKPSQVFCILDYETFSEADLKKCGAYEYSKHPSTDITCLAWRVGTKAQLKNAPIRSWAPLLDDTPSAWQAFGELTMILTDPDIIIVAHNAFFDHMITRHTLARRYIEHASDAQYIEKIPFRRWVCSAALASALALPRRLEDVAKVLHSPILKDMTGNRLMKKWMKPRKPTKNNPSTRHSNIDELKRIIEYCVADIAAQTHVFLSLPDLTPTERKLWLLDQRLNYRGFQVDRPLIRIVQKMIKTETEALEAEAVALADGAFTSTTQRAAVLEFVRNNGAVLPDLQKGTVEEAIKEGLVDGKALEVLRLRQQTSLTSLAKYPVLALRSKSDGRVRDNLMYHAASTGRWGGTGVQPQNLPRGTVKNTIAACKDILTKDLEWVRLIHGEPMQVFSSCVRNMIIAPEGMILDVADYSQIEVRVLFWVAGDERGMKAFREKRDIYKETASRVFSKPIGEINDFERFLGKQLELGCGYGMGPPKFVESCEKLGQTVSLELAEKGVKIYRDTHPDVTMLWKLIERAAISAVQNPGTVYSVKRTKWWMEGRFLWCELPSGRRLAYADPTLKSKLTPWGESRPTLYHYGIDSKTKKWVNSGTYGGKLVENVIQAIARDIMATAMLRIEATKVWKVTLTVHDELIAERPEIYGISKHYDSGKMTVNHPFIKMMTELPEWAEGCPIAAEGWSGVRYKK